jgi:hypothetical protein
MLWLAVTLLFGGRKALLGVDTAVWSEKYTQEISQFCGNK